jgi:hypothetical protein
VTCPEHRSGDSTNFQFTTPDPDKAAAAPAGVAAQQKSRRTRAGFFVGPNQNYFFFLPPFFAAFFFFAAIGLSMERWCAGLQRSSAMRLVAPRFFCYSARATQVTDLTDEYRVRAFRNLQTII